MKTISIILMLLTSTLFMSCSSLKKGSDLSPVSDAEFNQILNKDNIRIEKMYQKLMKLSVSSCVYEKYEFGTTEVCSLLEKNLIYIKRNNQVIYQSNIIEPDESQITVDQSKRQDLAI